MISSGNATVYVSDMNAAIRFYTESVGLKLTNRFGRQWAILESGPSYWSANHVGAGLMIGLHAASPKHPAPGTRGAVGFGFETCNPIEEAMASLVHRKVAITGEVIRFEGGNSVAFEDHDGTPTYLHEFPPEMVSSTDPAAEEDSGEEAPAPISGGHAIVYVTNMDAAIRFYTGVLGLNLTNRYGDKLATVEAGRLVIALHPQSSRSPVPGTKGSVTLGLTIDEPIRVVVSRLIERGVRLVGGPIESDGGNIANLEDVDGNSIYLCEDDRRLSTQDDLAVQGSEAT